eukprot:2336915-Amphidinium_carterae.2
MAAIDRCSLSDGTASDVLSYQGNTYVLQHLVLQLVLDEFFKFRLVTNDDATYHRLGRSVQRSL